MAIKRDTFNSVLARSGAALRKRSSPEELLQFVIGAIQGDDGRQLAIALESLHMSGPFVRTGEGTGERDYSLVGGELWAFLDSIVRRRLPASHFTAEDHQQSYGAIGTHGHLTFRAFNVDGRVLFSMDGKYWRDMVILQLILLVDRVGLKNVLPCAATDCPRIFVKRYRRTHCSTTCQQRTNKRLQRLNRREKAERRADRKVRAQRSGKARG